MMNLIKFHKKYYNDIITGKKTQTLRRNNKRINKDETVKAIFTGTDKECKLKITDTGYKQFKSIDQEDAEKEGYTTIAELKNTLIEIYPNIDKFDRLYYYRFEVL